MRTVSRWLQSVPISRKSSRPQFLLLAAALLAALAWPTPSTAQIRAVWAAHEGLGLRRDEPVAAARMRNVVWDGRRVSLVAARNEIVAFEVIVEAGDRGVQGLTLSLP